MRLIGSLAFGGLVSLALIASSEPARGGFVTESVSTPPGGTPTDFSLPLTVSNFDKSLGQLTSVVITYTVSAVMQGTITNTADSPETFRVTESSLFTLALQGHQLLSNTLSAEQDWSGMKKGDTGSFGAFQTAGTTAPLTLTSGAAYDQFLSSSSNITFNFASLTSTTTVGGGGNASTAIYTNASASLSITYNYNSPAVSVPEPSSLVMTWVGGLVVSGSTIHQSRKRRRIRSIPNA